VRPDPEQLAVEWAKAQPELVEILEARIATALPADNKFEKTFLRVIEIDGRDLVAESSEVAVALLQWDAYAFEGFQPAPDWAKASLIARTLIERMTAERGRALASGVLLDFAHPTGPRRQTEQTGRARYSVDVFVAVRPA
jgi:hypothetical protein